MMASNSARRVDSWRGDRVPLVGVAGEGDFGDVGRHDALFQRHVLLFEGENAVPALGRFAHHGEGGILVDLESGQRIGEKSDFHGAFR